MYDMYHWDEADQHARPPSAAFARARDIYPGAEPPEPPRARYRPAGQLRSGSAPASTGRGGEIHPGEGPPEPPRGRYRPADQLRSGPGNGGRGRYAPAAWALQVALDRRDNGGDASPAQA